MYDSHKRLWLVSALAASIALAGCNPGGGKDDDDNGNGGGTTEPPVDTDAKLAPYDERDVRDDVFYFVMPDRFNDGDTSNNFGGLGGDKFTHGYDPTDKAFYHGGDMAGLEAKLDYLEDMGVTAIWMTPILKNKAVQGEGEDASSAYHGYWTLDFTQIDPHLGTNEDLKSLIDAAHERDIKIFFDIITNHTADVIKYEECHDPDGTYQDGIDRCAYKSLEDVANGDTYTPFVPTGEENVKVPAWLNDTRYYHNQGDSTFSGENSVYGDFVGLDDLATSNQAVIDGMIDIFKNIVTDFQPDGFRIDTVKHVHTEFWQQFAPAIVDHAKSEGIDNFTMFGEVYSADPDFLSTYTTEGKIPSVLDFGFQAAVSAAVSGGDTPETLRNLFLADDKYSDHDSDASTLMNFTGNHDMGRFGYFLGGADTPENLAKMKLAHAMMYFLRGVPVVYYGDEQGFTGIGGDQSARENMFPSQVEEYNNNDLIGTSATTADDNFDDTHPIYTALAEYAEVLREHKALRQGVQHERYAESGTKGAYVVSRIDPDENVEYLVAFNTSNIATTVYVEAAANGYSAVYGAEDDAVLDQGDVKLQIPAYGVVIYKAKQERPASPAPDIAMTGFENGEARTGTLEIGLDITGLDSLALPDYEATFEYSTDGGTTWHLISRDFNAPYRSYFRLGEFADGTDITVQATVTNSDGEMDVVTRDFIADSRYPDTVTVSYSNPNSRDALYVVSDGGEFQGPIPANAGEYTFAWGEDDTANHLIWASLDDQAGTAAFDEPFTLTRTELFAHSSEDGSGGLTASLVVDARAAVNLTGTAVDLIVNEGKAVDDSIDGLNLRGGIVGWDAGSAVDMTNTEYSTYHAEAFVLKGDGEFKFADDQWAAINIGGPVTTSGLTQGANPANLLNDFEADSVYDFWVVGVDSDADGGIDLRIPFIEIDHGNLGEVVYLRGSLTDWNLPGAPQLAHQGGSVYRYVLNDLAAGDYEFKIADSDWTDVNYGYNDVTIHADSVALTNPGNGNIGLSVVAENDYTFTLDVSDPANPVLKVESSEVPPYDAHGALYLKGELNGWANIPAYELGFVGNGQYRTTIAIDPASFDYSGDTSTAIDFAIANAGWGYKLAGASTTLTAGGSVTLSDADGSNALMDSGLTAGYYDLTLDASVNPSAPTLALAANGDHTYGDLFGEPMYVRGSFNDWSNDVAVDHNGLIHSDTVTLAAGTALFKIVNDDWSRQVQFDDVVRNGGLALTGADDGFGGLNISVEIGTAGDYRITLDTTNPTRMMLTVEAVTP